MVFAAEWDHVVEVGWTSGFPVVDVVDLAVVERFRAVGYRTCGVDRLKCAPLVGSGQASRSSDIEWDAVATEYDRDDVRLAGEAANGRGGKIGSIGGAAHGVGMKPVAQGVEIDMDNDFGARRCDSVTR